jgi:hypothetical protein
VEKSFSVELRPKVVRISRIGWAKWACRWPYRKPDGSIKWFQESFDTEAEARQHKKGIVFDLLKWAWIDPALRRKGPYPAKLWKFSVLTVPRPLRGPTGLTPRGTKLQNNRRFYEQEAKSELQCCN